MYKILFTKHAYKAFSKLPRDVATWIRKRMDKIVKDPFAPYANVAKLQNRSGYRLRVGDWRVIYEIRKEELIILVLRVGSRGDIYR